MKSVIKSALVLTAIAFVAGVLLAVVNKFTYLPYEFSFTAVDIAAVKSITESENFDVIDHDEIKADEKIRVILRVKDGPDAGNYLVRAYGTGPRGNIETYTLIKADNNSIKKVALTEYDAGNNYISGGTFKVNEFTAKFEGKTSLGPFNKAADGQLSATDSSQAFYGAVKNGFDYYLQNTAAIKGAVAKKTVSTNDQQVVEDKLLTAIKTLYSNAASYKLLGTFEDTYYKIKTYATDKADFVFMYEGTVSYSDDEGHSGSYTSELLMKMTAGGEVDGNPVFISGDKSFFDIAIDGQAGATASSGFITTAKSRVASYYNNYNGAVGSDATVKKIYSLGTASYLIIVSGTVYPIDPEEDHFDEYGFLLAITITGGQRANVEVIKTDNWADYMGNGIDGNVGATRSESAVNAAVNRAKNAVGVL